MVLANTHPRSQMPFSTTFLLHAQTGSAYNVLFRSLIAML